MEQLGVPRQSLYNTFGDKEDIYNAALARYRSCQESAFQALLQDPRPVRAVLRDLFAAKVDDMLREPQSWGCLLLNAALERPDDAKARREVRKGNEAIQGALAERFRRAQTAGEIGPHHDPAALGRFFHGALVGMSVIGRGTRDRKVLEDIARVALATLG